MAMRLPLIDAICVSVSRRRDERGGSPIKPRPRDPTACMQRAEIVTRALGKRRRRRGSRAWPRPASSRHELRRYNGGPIGYDDIEKRDACGLILLQEPARDVDHLLDGCLHGESRRGLQRRMRQQRKKQREQAHTVDATVSYCIRKEGVRKKRQERPTQRQTTSTYKQTQTDRQVNVPISLPVSM